MLPAAAILAPPRAAAHPALICDPNDPQDAVIEYIVYEQTADGLAEIGRTDKTEFTLANVALGPHTYVVTARAIRGGSCPAIAPPPPAAPNSSAGVRVTVRVGGGREAVKGAPRLSAGSCRQRCC